MDFVQLTDGAPTRFIESKVSETKPEPALLYLKRKFPSVPAVQVVARHGIDRVAAEGIRVCSADLFLRELLV